MAIEYLGKGVFKCLECGDKHYNGIAATACKHTLKSALPKEVEEEEQFECEHCNSEWNTEEGAIGCCVCGDCYEYPCECCESCEMPPDSCECCSNCGNAHYNCTCCSVCGTNGEYSSCSCHCPECGDEWDEEHCAACDYDAEQGTCVEAVSVVLCNDLGIDASLDLSKNAADYYLLQNMWQTGRNAYALKALKKMANDLVPQFVNYFDIAIGGEVRHGGTTLEYIDEDVLPLPQDFRHLTRVGAWEQWHTWRTQIERIEFASKAFVFRYKKNKIHGWVIPPQVGTCPPFIGSMGGPKWHSIAEALLMYLRDEIDGISWLDRVWNLQHNGGCALNKIYSTKGLNNVLAAHGVDAYVTLLDHCSQSTRDMWEQHILWMTRKDLRSDEEIGALQMASLNAAMRFHFARTMIGNGLGSVHVANRRALAVDHKTREELARKAVARRNQRLARAKKVETIAAIESEYTKATYLADTMGRSAPSGSIRRAIYGGR